LFALEKPLDQRSIDGWNSERHSDFQITVTFNGISVSTSALHMNAILALLRRRISSGSACLRETEAHCNNASRFSIADPILHPTNQCRLRVLRNKTFRLS
jgi:hypothetical protein